MTKGLRLPKPLGFIPTKWDSKEDLIKTNEEELMITTKKWSAALMSAGIFIGAALGGITYAASAPPTAAAHFPGLPATPPASAFVPTRADAPPLVTHLTPTQMQLGAAQK